MTIISLCLPKRVKYKVIILTRRCLIGTTSRYLAADCVPVSEMAQRRHIGLRSDAGYQLVVPSYPLNSCGLWNSLHRLLRDTSHIISFGHSLKIFFSQSTSAYAQWGFW